MTDDLFRARLKQMIDLKYPLAVLANRLPWAQLESTLAPAFARKTPDGKVIAGSDLFGATIKIAGRPRLSIRLRANPFQGIYPASELSVDFGTGGVR